MTDEFVIELLATVLDARRAGMTDEQILCAIRDAMEVASRTEPVT